MSAPSSDLPKHWSPSACDLFEEVLDEAPDMPAADVHALEQAAELVTTAELLEATSRAAGGIATGSTGQVVAHPAGVEARLARTAVAAILARLSPTAAVRSKAKASRALASRRDRGLGR
ncbi:MAG: hypothetical protein DI534_11910 [Leifsonia xyli]|nr:MAG: hypothetical protein DI534_11910 [Leifsonia xyli]